MRSTQRFMMLLVLASLAVAPAFAQVPTGTLSGHVTDGKDALPGVTITVSSPSLQGVRTTVSSSNGDYIFTFLPPGEYKAKFDLPGFQTVETTLKINAAQSQRLDATMPQAKVAEEVTVTGAYETIQAQGTAATSVAHDLVYKLPVAKDINNIALLTAGVIASPAAQGAPAINGAPSYDNQFLVNGVAIMDNVRGTATPLFIEDAIEETTTSTSAISAEYGRFTGGVINALTKSGGNEFHASARDTLTSDKWTEVSPLQTTARNDTINNQYELTLGGFILKDHLWFFAAGRKTSTSLTGQLGVTNISVPQGVDQKRYEGKLTLALNANHRIIGSYLKVDETDLGYFFNVSGFYAMDLPSVYDRQTPNDLTAVNYTGVLSDNFFVEGQYSKKTFLFQNSGARYTDIARGTDIWDYWNFPVIETFNSPLFCAVCPNATEHRDNDDYLAKASWFLSGKDVGTHDLVVGYDRFEDKVLSNNWQSGSGYMLLDDGEVGYVNGFGTPTGPAPWLDANGSPYPVFIANGFSSYVNLYPILDISNGNNFRTDSFFVNDKWRLSNNLSFNVGVRYDRNHGENAAGVVVSNDSNVSPRLGVTWDPAGDGNLQIQASYARYVAGLANSVADVSPAGTPGNLSYLYGNVDPSTGDPIAGLPLPPTINAQCDPAHAAATGCVTAQQAVVQVLDWFNGLTTDQKAALLTYASVPGYNVKVEGSLDSPNVQEYTVGASTRLGSRGQVRVDYVHRKWADFYTDVTDTTTGHSEQDPYGNVYDMTYLRNTNALQREYNGVNISGEYRFSEVLEIGGNYTWSTLKGNFNGETGGAGPGAASVQQYPEYLAFAQNNPAGYLLADQRHRLRVYAVFDLLNSKHNRLSVSVMDTYATGTPYSAVGSIATGPYVANPGYLTPPSLVNYYFSPRGAFRMDNINSTNISVNYAFVIPGIGSGLQFFIEPRVTNVFNEHGVVNVNTTVYTSHNAGKGLVGFDPFTTQPVECPQGDTPAQCSALGANWQLGPNFGKPLQPTTAANTLGDFQRPRTFVISFGVRF